MPPHPRTSWRAPAGHLVHPAAGWALVALGVTGVSLAAPIGAATAAPALAVAFWRAGLGAALTAPFAVYQVADPRTDSPRGLAARHSIGAGVWLALHFALWIPSLRLTSVAASTALVATTPVWIVGWRWVTGRPPGRRMLAGLALALGGVLAVTGVDASGSARALMGDALALAGGMAAAGYVLSGETARRRTPTATYTLIAYATCAALLAPVCLLTGVALAGYQPRTWVELGVLTLAAQLLGHSALNAALPVVGATPLSLAILLEVPGAVLVAWVWLGTLPPAAVLPGALAVLAGLVLVARGPAPPPGDAAAVL